MAEAEDSIVKPVWGLAANIVEERLYGPGGSLSSRGTKHFKPGAKVYVVSFYWGGAGEVCTVVGRHRGSHRFVIMDLRTNCLTNPRTELVYSPHVIRQIVAHGPQRRVDEQLVQCDAEWGGSEEAKAFVDTSVENLKGAIERMRNEILSKRANSTENPEVAG